MRSSHQACILAFGLTCTLAFCSVRLLARRHDNVQELAARIQRESKPVKKAKLEIRMGTLLLDQAADAYDQHKIAQGQKLLSNSTHEMQDAAKLLDNTGRNAAKKPDGFMQLEIALRENARTLTELRERVFYLYRAPIDQALKTMSQTHAHVLVELFPGAVPPAAPSPPEKNAAGLHNASKHAAGAAGKGAQP